MHRYGLRHDGLASSPAEKDLKHPAEKVITVDSWVNMSQEHAFIANKGNCVMRFTRGIMASRLEKISMPLYLVLVKPRLQYWVQFWLSPPRNGGETREHSVVGCQDGQGPRTYDLQR